MPTNAAPIIESIRAVERIICTVEKCVEMREQKGLKWAAGRLVELAVEVQIAAEKEVPA